MKIGDLVQCDDYVFDGIIGIIIEMLPGRTQRTHGVRLLTYIGYRRVALHNLTLIKRAKTKE